MVGNREAGGFVNSAVRRLIHIQNLRPRFFVLERGNIGVDETVLQVVQTYLCRKSAAQRLNFGYFLSGDYYMCKM